MAVRFWLENLKRRLQAKRYRANRITLGSSRSTPAEILENRTLLAAHVLFIGNELQVLGDGGEDVTVQESTTTPGNVAVLIDGIASTDVPSLAATSVQSLYIETGDDNNSVDVSGLTSAVFTNLTSITILTGNGNDVIIGSTDFGETVDGGDGNDSITGNGGDDSLSGGDGADTIDSGDGNDTVDAGNGDDSVLSGNGDDLVLLDDGADTVSGGLGNDSIHGGNGTDSILGDDGNDTLVGDEGNDTVSAGIGDDMIYGGGNDDSLAGDAGNDSIIANGGNDAVDGGDGNDSIGGREGRDTLLGSAGNDTIVGDEGNDQIEGGDGDDALVGGAGNDLMYGETVLGGGTITTSSDTIIGNGGDDSIYSNTGADSVRGGTGNDYIDLRSPSLSVADIRIDPEGNSGQTTQAVFTVTLSSPVALPVTVDYTTFSDGTATGGTATEDIDYQRTTDSLTFLPGETSKTVTVNVIGDNFVEGEETFFLNLSNAANAAIFDGSGEGRIIDDDDSSGTITDLDVFLLLDDTSSFSGTIDNVRTAFTQVITNLQQQAPGSSLAFGVGRFEAYTAGPFGASTDRPFILNQPIITDSTGQFQASIDAALARDAIGSGQGAEPAFEALFQIATGAGFDGNGNGNSTGDGPAGLYTTQTTANPSGDIPAFSTFTQDMTGDPLGPILNPTVGVSSAIDGVGFRPNARHIVLLASDSFGFVYQDDGLATYTGANGSSVPASTFSGGIIQTPGGRGATIQNTIDLLLANNIQVVGLGSDAFFGGNIQSQLTSIALLTGTVNTTSAAIENNLTPGPSADDIQPGDPLYFDVTTVSPNQLAATIVTAIIGAAGPIVTPPPPPPPAPPASPPTGPQEDTVDGETGNDTIFASDSNDALSGSDGNDSIDGGNGTDTITGGNGDDTLNGGDGDDVLNGNAGNDSLVGGTGEDDLQWDGAGSGNDTVNGGDGGDTATINGSSAANTITVGQDASGNPKVTAGTDSVTIAGGTSEVFVNGNGGDDTITVNSINKAGLFRLVVSGGDGNDLIKSTTAVLGSALLEMNGDAGNDTINGGASVETINGGTGDDSLTGGGSGDVINGDDGNDTLNGQAGADTLDGGLGDDSLSGETGADRISGSFGNDAADGGDGNDTIDGGFGNDSLQGSTGNDSVSGGSGVDFLGGGAGADTLDGGRNNDTLLGNSGNDKLRGDHGDDSLNSGTGDDEVNGGDGNDTIDGGDGLDGLSGGNGNDFISGGLGKDTLYGGDGDDSLFGGSGNDTLLGGDGNDQLSGNSGTDFGAVGEGADPAPVSVETIDETFVITAKLLAKLDGI